MDTLPIELIDHIVSYVTERDDKISLACVSRHFQLAVETSTFSRINLKSFELVEFRNHFRLLHRRNALRHIQYAIRLPAYDATSSKRLENAKEKRVNNRVFTMATIGLLQVLKSWEQDQYQDYDYGEIFGGYGVGIHLQICKIFSNLKTDHPATNTERVCRPQPRRYKHSYLKLVPVSLTSTWGIVCGSYSGMTFEEMDHSEVGKEEGMETEYFLKTLPEVQSITRFSLGCLKGLTRKIELQTAALLAATMPNLKTWTIKAPQGYESNFAEWRQKMRLEFGQTLLNLSISGNHFLNLKTLNLRTASSGPYHHSYSITALHPEHPTTDFLSVGLRALSCLPNIKTLQLGKLGVWQTSISPSFFWPDSIEGTRSPPSWPALEHLELAISPITPAGTWYITRDSSPPPKLHLSSENRVPAHPVTPSAMELRTEAETLDPFFEVGLIPPNLLEVSLRLGRRLYIPVHFFRTVLDPDTLIPLLISVLKMISVARQQKLARMELTIDFSKYMGEPSRFVGLTGNSTAYFRLSFFRRGVGGLDHDELVLLVSKDLKWERIGDREEVIKALSETLGEDGVVTVDPEFCPSAPGFLRGGDSSDDEIEDYYNSVSFEDESDSDTDTDEESIGHGNDVLFMSSDEDDDDEDDYGSYDEDDEDYNDYGDEDDVMMRTRMKVRMTRRDWPR